jgi:hypothetical protein
MVSPPFPETNANLLNCNSNFSSRFAGNLARNGENEIDAGQNWIADEALPHRARR